MRVYHITTESFDELSDIPSSLPQSGYIWIACSRRQYELNSSALQAHLQRWNVGALVDLHVADLLSNQLPSHFDYTSWYDLMVFRRLTAGVGSDQLFVDDAHGTLSTAQKALHAIDTSPVGFAVFDQVLISVHPAECQVREYFAKRLTQAVKNVPGTPEQLRGGRMPTSPADLMLRMVNYMVDSYLDLRRLLTRQLGYLQSELLRSNAHFSNWQLLLESRNTLHMLEDVCEDQRAAVQEWIDALGEWPAENDPQAARDRELLRLRSRDVLEHIERVLSHVRRLESTAEAAVQMHFSALGHRTNQVMRTLTVLTAVFMPLTLITGIFGMNFEHMPLLKHDAGFWLILIFMGTLGGGLAGWFWRKRYLRT